MPYSKRDHGLNLEIQALRGIAILTVVSYHMIEMVPGLRASLGQLANHFHGGRGVDLFFVISGYVITRSTLPKISGTLPPQEGILFWLRRICRTLPPAIIWLGIVLLVALMVPSHFGPAINQLKHALAALLQYANVYIIECGATQTCGVFGYYWTLSTEEQFYFLFPFLFALAPVRYLRWIAPAVGLMLAVLYSPIPRSLGLSIPFFDMQSLRFDGLFLGVAIALLQNTSGFATILGFLNRRPMLTLLLSAICHWCIWTQASGASFISPYIVTSVLCAALVVMAIPDRGYTLLKAPLSKLGTVSYSMYLCHVVIIIGANALVLSAIGTTPQQIGYWIYMPLLWLVIIGVSAGSYYSIELPAKLLGRRITDANRPNFPPNPIPLTK